MFDLGMKWMASKGEKFIQCENCWYDLKYQKPNTIIIVVVVNKKPKINLIEKMDQLKLNKIKNFIHTTMEFKCSFFFWFSIVLKRLCIFFCYISRVFATRTAKQYRNVAPFFVCLSFLFVFMRGFCSVACARMCFYILLLLLLNIPMSRIWKYSGILCVLKCTFLWYMAVIFIVAIIRFMAECSFWSIQTHTLWNPRYLLHNASHICVREGWRI